MNYLIGIGGIVLILAIAFLFSSNRRWIRPRVVGAAFALQAGHGGAGVGHQRRPICDRQDVDRRLQPARLRQGGRRFYLRPTRQPRDRRQQLRARRAAGDHLLRRADLDPLLSRHHAARHQMGRRRDPAGDRHHPRRIAGRGGQHLRRPVGKPAGDQALSRQSDPLAALPGDDRRHGRRRRHHPRRLCEHDRRQHLCPICSPPASCRRRAAS